MKTLQNITEKVEKEFEDRFSPDWWKGFGTSDDIDKLGIEGIKSFLSSAIKEAIQTAFEETRVENKDTEGNWQTKCPDCKKWFPHTDKIEIIYCPNCNNMNKTLENIIESKKFDWVNPDITSKNFPTQPIRGEVKIFHFDRDISSKDVIHEMAKEGYEPANIYELLNWKDWNGKDWVVALGSVWRDFFGRRNVPRLYLVGDDRRLGLSRWAGDWGGRFRFAGIKKEANLVKNKRGRRVCKICNNNRNYNE